MFKTSNTSYNQTKQLQPTHTRAPQGKRRKQKNMAAYPTFYYNFRIYLDDTDAGGIVYHANHIKYMERARREWLREQGVAHYSARDDYQFVVAKVDIDYHTPLLMDDLLTISLTAEKIGFASMQLTQKIYRSPDDVTQAKPATSAMIKLACVDKTLKPARIPQDLMSAITTVQVD